MSSSLPLLSGLLLLVICQHCSLVTSVPFTSENNVTHTCTMDSHCSAQMFCVNHMCERCIPCEDYGRTLTSDPRGCAKELGACGPCLDGYKAEEHTGQTVSFICMHAPATTSDQNNAVYYAIIGVLVVVVIALGIVVFCQCKKKNTGTHRSQRGGRNSSIPHNGMPAYVERESLIGNFSPTAPTLVGGPGAVGEPTPGH